MQRAFVNLRFTLIFFLLIGGGIFFGAQNVSAENFVTCCVYYVKTPSEILLIHHLPQAASTFCVKVTNEGVQLKSFVSHEKEACFLTSDGSVYKDELEYHSDMPIHNDEANVSDAEFLTRSAVYFKTQTGIAAFLNAIGTASNAAATAAKAVKTGVDAAADYAAKNSTMAPLDLSGTDQPLELRNLNKLGITDVSTLVARVIKSAMGIMGTIAFAFFIYGGVLWMTAAGASDKIKKAQSIIVWTSIGIIMIFASYAIVQLVFEAVT